MKRHVFFISDGTGITAETLGLSLISQFTGLEFSHNTIPYVDSLEKAEAALAEVNQIAEISGDKPIVFMTLLDKTYRELIAQHDGLTIDLFSVFIPELEKELNLKASGEKGRSHGVHDNAQYHERIEAINYTLSTDDGLNPNYYDSADVILIGVSRSGKTPTSLYLALHYGVATANYPLTDDDLLEGQLPKALRAYTKKCFALTIDPRRLQQIRAQRRREGSYSTIGQCEREVRQAKAIFEHYDIPMLDTTELSVEEISTRIVSEMKLVRKIG
ncbi:MAG: pyruvate, water dikinase regulatory protein [Gammaproteobacteria bacterium]